MTTAQLTADGQITIPLEVRRKLGLSEGGTVLFVEEGEDFLITNEQKPKFRLSDEQIEAALKKGWSMKTIRLLG
jgi:AbrB family looped-hinge helix DNA binding protein